MEISTSYDGYGLDTVCYDALKTDHTSELTRLLETHKLCHIEVFLQMHDVHRIEDVTPDIITKVTPFLQTALDKSRFKKMVTAALAAKCSRDESLAIDSTLYREQEQRVESSETDESDEINPVCWYSDGRATSGDLRERLRGVKQGIDALNVFLSVDGAPTKSTDNKCTSKAMETIRRSKEALLEEADKLKEAIAGCQKIGMYTQPKPVFPPRFKSEPRRIRFSECLSSKSKDGTKTCGTFTEEKTILEGRRAEGDRSRWMESICCLQ